ncbi:lytic transglycosylase domain-containing protein [Sphingomonas sp. Y38-1Y]|uniref:lytic transglycosylase domain-containing protein n=1 Tax=Sphingomonas sp. Y38-1Y TaxID=3078265 RepID=UPI0028F0550D|nr:lytic transglycosylase domain-containing protein [Sphingomonas sp. Y38-1Y]
MKKSNYKVAIAGALLSVFFTPSLAAGRDDDKATRKLKKEAERYFIECPVEDQVRVANVRASERYAALSNCGNRIVHVPPTVLPADLSVARIIGVEDEDEAPAKKRARERRAKTPVVISSHSGGRVPVSSYDAHIFRTAAAYKVDPLFLHAIIATESAGNPKAVSYVGARGLMQIMPATGRGLGVQPVALFDPAVNVDAGARHLKRLQKRYGRNFDLILGAYNAGEGAVARYGNRVPPYAETQAYVRKVMSRYQGYRQAGLAR